MCKIEPIKTKYDFVMILKLHDKLKVNNTIFSAKIELSGQFLI